MLRFLRSADEIFQDVVQEALTWMIEDLRDNGQDPEAYQDLAPRTARLLEPPLAIEAFEALKACHESLDLYQLKLSHRVLLIDALTRYCDLYNEEPFGGSDSAVHQKYGLRHLDAERLNASFIGPTGARGHRAHGAVDSERLQGRRMRPHELVLQRLPQGIEPESVLPATGSPWYRVGTESYPMAVLA